MRVFVKYFNNIKQKVYTNSKLDKGFDYRNYNSKSYIYDRNNGPTYLIYKFDELIYKSYRINNRNHRLNGPSEINYETNDIQFWINGKRYNNEFEYWITIGNYRKEK